MAAAHTALRHRHTQTHRPNRPQRTQRTQWPQSTYSMRPLSLSARFPLNLDPIDFDARVAAWEKNEAREASFFPSSVPAPVAPAAPAGPVALAAAAPYPALSPSPSPSPSPYSYSYLASQPTTSHHSSTTEPISHHHLQHQQRHHRTLQVCQPTTPSPSPHNHHPTHRYPILDVHPRQHPSYMLNHSSLRSPAPAPTPASNQAGNRVTPTSTSLVTAMTITPEPTLTPASQPQSHSLAPLGYVPGLQPNTNPSSFHTHTDGRARATTTTTLSPLLSPLSVAQGNDTTRLHYDLRTLSADVRLSARDHTTDRAPERYLPASDVHRLMHKPAFHPSLTSVSIVSSLFPWVIPVDVGHNRPILIHDVLSAIHAALHKEVTPGEWRQLPQTHQQRITAAQEDALALALVLSDSSSPPPTARPSSSSSPWYSRIFPATPTAPPCCKPEYHYLRHPNEAGILPPRGRGTTGTSRSEEEQGNEKTIVLRKREHAEGVLRIDWVCGKTRWGGLVRDDEIARRRGVPRERWERTWCLVLE